MQIVIQKGLFVQLGIIELDTLRISHSQAISEALQKCADGYCLKYSERSAGQVEGIQHARHMFRAIGIDPTKRRPSSEALLRRAMKGQSLYSVNTLVDVCNWCSLDFLMPICIYDMEKILGDVQLRIGKAGERYLALNHQEINFENRYCFSDDTGPFGSPITDSVRTAVNLDTRHALFIIFASQDYPKNDLRAHLEVAKQRLADFCGGSVVQMGIIEGKSAE